MISQYANSPVITKLNDGLKEIFNDNNVLVDFYNNVVNPSTATGYGLDVWGAIIGQSREFYYNNSLYILRGAQTIGGVEYSEDDIERLYRTVLQIKALGNIGNFSFANINSMLRTLFKDKGGECYCIQSRRDDGSVEPMAIRYVFSFYISDLEKAIVETLNPHPAGVYVTFEYLPSHEFFGFITHQTSGLDEPFTPMSEKDKNNINGPFYR